MLMEATLCPTKTTKSGAPCTKLLSKIQSALGSLRLVVGWAPSRLRHRGIEAYRHFRRQKALQSPTLLGPMPQQAICDWDAACRRMRKIGRLVRNDLSLEELQHLAPDPHPPMPRGPPPPLERHHDPA